MSHQTVLAVSLKSRKCIESHLFHLAALMVALFLAVITPLSIAAPVIVDPQIENTIQRLAEELKTACPFADPGDQKAFDQCRQMLFGDSKLRQMLSPITLWGRQRDPNRTLKETHLTQFSPDVLSGLYASLFMFDGKYKVAFNDKEKLYLITLNVTFRNRLQPGQFPYPFWHEADKWTTYENAKTMLLWMDPATRKVRVAQFSVRGDESDSFRAITPVTHKFEGKWLWTDEHGKTQPAATLFDGLFHDDNPYKPKLESSYREFANTLRESQCFACHVPDNPQKMSRLVLLQTPAHAAAEIKRVLKDVRDKRMPVDELGIEQPLSPDLQKALEEKGGAFEKMVDLARDWEHQQSHKKK